MLQLTIELLIVRLSNQSISQPATTITCAIIRHEKRKIASNIIHKKRNISAGKHDATNSTALYGLHKGISLVELTSNRVCRKNKP